MRELSEKSCPIDPVKEEEKIGHLQQSTSGYYRPLHLPRFILADLGLSSCVVGAEVVVQAYPERNQGFPHDEEAVGCSLLAGPGNGVSSTMHHDGSKVSSPRTRTNILIYLNVDYFEPALTCRRRRHLVLAPRGHHKNAGCSGAMCTSKGEAIHPWPSRQILHQERENTYPIETSKGLALEMNILHRASSISRAWS